MRAGAPRATARSRQQQLQILAAKVAQRALVLAEEGSIWVNLDDNEAHYCKVLMDEVFARANFLANVIWEKSDSPRMDAEFFSARHDHILVYAKDRRKCQLNKGVTATAQIAQHYDKTTNDGRPYYLKPLWAMGGSQRRASRSLPATASIDAAPSTAIAQSGSRPASGRRSPAASM